MEIPKKIGRYEVENKITTGGMSVVYRARDPRLLNRAVAIKQIREEMSRKASFRARFDLELKTIIDLDHPNIVPVYEFFEENGVPCIVMRWMEGGTLAERIKQQRRFSLWQAFEIISPVASAIDALHQHDIIHRDIKPQNILFNKYDDAYLADFGIVKPLVEETESEQESLTQGYFIGSAKYASPEQFSGLSIQFASDIYSLGVVLFELLTGRLPYITDEDGPVHLKHLRADIPFILNLNPELPSRCQEIVDRTLAKKPEDRYQSAMELVDALRRLLDTWQSESDSIDSMTTATWVDFTPSEINYPTATHPFVYGTVVPPGKFVGRERQLRDILQLIRGGQSVTIVGSHHIGKSSLLYKLEERLKAEDTGLIPVRFRMEQIYDKLTQTTFWTSLVGTLQNQKDSLLDHHINMATKADFSPRYLRRVFNYLKGKRLMLVLMIDDFDFLLRNKEFHDPDFFGRLRSMATNGSLVIVTTSRLTVAEMDSEVPGVLDMGSAFFNPTNNHVLRPFTSDEIQAVLDEAGDNLLSDQQYEWVRLMAGHHPYLIQVSAASLIDCNSDEATAQQLLAERTNLFFTDVWNSLPHNSKVILLLMSLIEKVGVEQSRELLNSIPDVEEKFILPHIESQMAPNKLVSLPFTKGADRAALIVGDTQWIIDSVAMRNWITEQKILNQSKAQLAYEKWFKTRHYKEWVKKTVWQELIHID